MSQTQKYGRINVPNTLMAPAPPCRNTSHATVMVWKTTYVPSSGSSPKRDTARRSGLPCEASISTSASSTSHMPGWIFSSTLPPGASYMIPR